MNALIDATARFRHMKEGTAEDWQIIAEAFSEYAKYLPDRVMDHLLLLKGDFGGFPVDRLTHSLQTATLAEKDGRDEEYVVCALLHDIGDTLGTFNHADIAAAIIEPFASEENHWIVKHHAIFQGYYFFHHLGMDRNLRDGFRDHPLFRETAVFCEKYDAAAFDPEAETYPLEHFEPAIRRFFAEPRNSLYKKVMADGE